MTVMVLVVGAAILLTWMLVHSNSGREAPARRRARHAHGDGGWMFAGSDGSGADCSGGDAGCGDGGGGGD